MSMSIQNISAITSIDLPTIHRVLSSAAISESQKENFIKQNQSQIQKVLSEHISGSEFKFLMNSRPLKKFKFLKNSFTKRGDRILLAKTLGIEPAELDGYIQNVEDDLGDFSELSYLPKDKLDAIQTYIYRHGSKEDIVNFLDYELNSAKDILETLYRTLEYHTGGLADYFIRPVHKMSHKTLVKLYNVIDKNIKNAQKAGSISEEESNKIAKWALIRIYQIQQNSQFINAVKTLKTLNG